MAHFFDKLYQIHLAIKFAWLMQLLKKDMRVFYFLFSFIVFIYLKNERSVGLLRIEFDGDCY